MSMTNQTPHPLKRLQTTRASLAARSLQTTGVGGRLEYRSDGSSGLSCMA